MKKRKLNAHTAVIKCPYTLTKRQSVRAFLFTAKGEIARKYLKSF